MAKLIYHPKAKIEIEEAAEYYENCQFELGKSCLIAVESAVHRLTIYPTTWRKFGILFDEFWLIDYPTVCIIYSINDNEIFIVAVAHQRHKPDYWYNRVKGSKK